MKRQSMLFASLIFDLQFTPRGVFQQNLNINHSSLNISLFLSLNELFKLDKI